MAPERTAVPFLDSLRATGLLSDAQLAELAKCPEARDPAPTPLARVILQRGWLTHFQLNMIAAGSAKGLTVGPYLVLDRIGEGGMGTVYKARHQHMQRIVSLKVIRKEKLASPDAVKRFYQEVQMAGTLHHPNIVLAFDAGQAGQTHYFAMEYIDGVDLARLVKQKGPLAVALSCDYIRQAALGLQHAQKKGLVHRDVKPSNLLVSRDAANESDVVKLLDMGLARATGSGDMGLTKIGAVIGTPDYMAPEQAMNSKAADIRADLYSLGCSLYFLLTGKPPFSASELTEVLLKHQMEKPVPLAQQGIAAPKKVQAILDRLIAKHPDERYQTPAELIEDLEPFCRATTDAGHVKAQKEPPTEDWATMARDDTAEKQAPDRSATAVRPSRRKPVATEQARHKKRLLLIGIGGGAALLVLGLVLFLALRNGKPDSVAQGPKSSEPVKNPPTEKSDTSKAPQATHKGGNPDGDNPKPDHPPDDPPTVATRLPLTLPSNVTNAAAFSPDGKRVVLGTSQLRLWDIAANKQIHDFGGVQYNAVRGIAWSADGRRVLAGGLVFRDGKWDGAATLHEADTGKFVQTFLGNLSNNVAVALSADGLRVLTGGGIRRMEGKRAVRGPDGKWVYDDTSIRLWDATTGQELGTYSGPAGPTWRLAFAPDGKSFFAAGAPAQVPKFAPDGKTSYINTDGPDEGAAFIWEVDSKQMRRISLPKSPIDYAVLSPNGREIVYAGADQAFHFVNVADGKETRRSERLPRPPARAAWSRDGRYIACHFESIAGLPDTALITLMTTADAKVVLTFPGHEHTLAMLAISDDGRLILASSIDGTRLWELSSKKP